MTNQFNLYADEYDKWFEENEIIFQSELNALQEALPFEGTGIEIGIGTGRFANQLKINIGVEPSEKMSSIAKQRGITIINAVAENLPFKKQSFDFALMVTTVCFLTNILQAFSEVHRILKPNGKIILGIIDKNSKLGKMYEKEKSKSKFYNNANFYSTEEITHLLVKVGFINFSYWQTLSAGREKIVEKPKSGFGDGSFVVIKAVKN